VTLVQLNETLPPPDVAVSVGADSVPVLAEAVPRPVDMK
jgi:hypothetical protein